MAFKLCCSSQVKILELGNFLGLISVVVNKKKLINGNIVNLLSENAGNKGNRLLLCVLFLLSKKHFRMAALVLDPAQDTRELLTAARLSLIFFIILEKNSSQNGSCSVTFPASECQEVT